MTRSGQTQIYIMTTSFVLRRANTSRPSGDWSDDDYDVFADDQNVGRIFRAEAAHPDGRPWMWTIEFHQRRGEGPHQGHVASRDAAAAVNLDFSNPGSASGLRI